jgi:hypothetical protein
LVVTLAPAVYWEPRRDWAVPVEVSGCQEERSLPPEIRI